MVGNENILNMWICSGIDNYVAKGIEEYQVFKSVDGRGIR